MKVFKGTDKDMKCRDFQYELGKTVKDDGAVRCGDKGFHSCEAPLDVLRYYPIRDGNRYFVAEADGVIDHAENEDSKIASSELTLKAEIGIKDLINAHFGFTRKKAESGTKGGDWSNLAVGDWSNLAGGDSSNLAGGDSSNLAGGDWSSLAGGVSSNLAGGVRSNLAGGVSSNLAGGVRSSLAGGYRSNLAGGGSSNLAGGDCSSLAGGEWSAIKGGKNSIIAVRNGEKVSAGIGSIIAFGIYGYVDDVYTLIDAKMIVIDGDNYKPDVWYKLENGEIVEVK